MNMYILNDWHKYRMNQGFFDLGKLCAAFEFSDWFKTHIQQFDENIHDMSIADIELIVTELKTKMAVPSSIFSELDIIINLNKPLIAPFYPFTVEGFAIYKDGGVWQLYHIESGIMVSQMTNKGTGNLPISTKIAVITNGAFQGQGLTAELGRLYIAEVIPEGGIFEISAFHPASAVMAKKGGFTLNPETNTWILKL